MKNFILYLIIFLLAALLIFKFCSKAKETEPNNAREIELSSKIEQLVDEIQLRDFKIKELQKRKDKVKTQIVYREREIDEAIAKDSTNALVQYRQALTENGWTADGTESLTFREIGIGAKGLSRLPKMQLQINIQDSIITQQGLTITDQTYIIDGYKEVIELKDNSIEYYQNTLHPPYKLRADVGVKNDFSEGKIIPSAYGRLTYKIFNTKRFEAPIELEGTYNENGIGGSGRIGIGIKW